MGFDPKDFGIASRPIGLPGADAQALQARAEKASGSANKGSEGKEAATQFEALLMQQMMQSMWKTIPTKDSLLGSKDEETYRDMYNEFLAKDIAKGRGMGIKEVIERELTKNTPGAKDSSGKQASGKLGKIEL